MRPDVERQRPIARHQRQGGARNGGQCGQLHVVDFCIPYFVDGRVMGAPSTGTRACSQRACRRPRCKGERIASGLATCALRMRAGMRPEGVPPPWTGACAKRRLHV